MSPRDTEYLARCAALASARCRIALGRLPGRLTDAADPRAWVRERPVEVLAGTFALSAWLTSRLSSSERTASGSNATSEGQREDGSTANHAGRSHPSLLDLGSAWFAPIVSLAARRIFASAAELSSEPTTVAGSSTLAESASPRACPEFDPL